jgi:hypothetical protein
MFYPCSDLSSVNIDFGYYKHRPYSSWAGFVSL